MCTGRVDLEFVLRALSKGADGVFIGGCWLGECHYVTEGNYDALFNMHFGRKLLEQIGIDPKRLRLEWISASEGTRYAEVMNDFGKQLKELGPLGQSEGLDAETLKLMLLRGNPLSARDIADTLGIAANEVSRHLSSSSRLGLVRFNEDEKRFALAS
jgi:coenzyme F420-reducing hydrogenase delta subunit